MKYYFLIFLICTVCKKSVAQLPVTDATNSALQGINLKIQSAMQVIDKYNLQNLSSMKGSSQNLLKLTKDFQTTIKKVNGFINNCKEVTESSRLQQAYIVGYYNGMRKVGVLLQGKERQYFTYVMNQGLKKSFEIYKQTKIVLKSDFYQMSDGERLSKLQAIQDELMDWNRKMNAFIKKYQGFAMTY